MKLYDLLTSLEEDFDDETPAEYDYNGAGKYVFTIPDKKGNLNFKVYFIAYEGYTDKASLKKMLKIMPDFNEMKPTFLSFYLNDKATLSNTGHVKKVFATIIDIMKHYIKGHAPKYIAFVAEDTVSRYRFYKSLINRIDRYTNEYSFYKEYKDPDRSATYFVLKRI